MAILNQQAQTTQETPVHAKSVHTNVSYQSGVLDQARMAVFDNLGMSIPQITFQAFLQFLAPPQPQFNFDLTMESLKNDPKGILPSGRWSSFNRDPKYQGKTENTVTLTIADIFNKVVDAIIANSQLKMDSVLIQFLHEPNKALMSSASQNPTKPDGYLVLKQRLTEGIVSWADILLPCEYKLNDRKRDLNDNVRKCVWSMQHIMRSDPCRRAAFSMTIENVNTRLWFSCRSAVIVSEQFNFINEPELLVKLFAAFAFADRRSLGFDPTIQRVTGQPEQFVITVHPDHNSDKPRKFLTKGIISSSGAEPLRGRGTRVFEAIEIDELGHEQGQNVVLKDIWVDKDHTREGKILTQLYDEAKGVDKGLVQKYFLTTVCHGDVCLEPEISDDTDVGLMRRLKTTDGTFSLLGLRNILNASSSSESPYGTELFQDHRPHEYTPKAHYRIVFKEKGVTIDHVSLFHDVLDTLANVVDALHLLRRLGWVHRDISIGNILMCEGGAKLADLEYAKKVDSILKGHKMRTGTLHFMAIEVAAHMYLFPPVSSTIVHDRPRPQTHRDTPTSPWTYNHLHDLESLWWVAAWIVYNNCFRGPDDDLDNLKETSEEIRLALFPPALHFGRQNNFMIGFSTMVGKVPSPQYETSCELDILRQILLEHYRKVESTLPSPINLDASENNIYSDFKTAFTSLQSKSLNYTLFLISRLHAQMANPKRDREQETCGRRQSSKKRAVI